MGRKILTTEGPIDNANIAREVGPDKFPVDTAAITLSTDWQGKAVCFKQACTVTIPPGLPADFSCGWSQEAAGAVTFVAGAGVTIQSMGGLLASGGQYAVGGISYWDPNVIRLYGQMA